MAIADAEVTSVSVARDVQVLDVTVDGTLAHASVVLTSEAARFESTYTLTRRDGRWYLLQDATVFTPGQ